MAGFGSPCGACKFLRRKCISGCVFAPYFRHEQGAAHFAAIHKVFGASNFAKMLVHLPAADRSEAAVTISYEAQARLLNPVYGCVAHIFALQQQVVNLQAQVAILEARAALHPPQQSINQSAAGGTRTPEVVQVASGGSSSMDAWRIGSCSNWVSELQDFAPCNLDGPMASVAEDLSSFGVENTDDFTPSSNCVDPQDSFWKSAYQEMLGVHENSGYQI